VAKFSSRVPSDPRPNRLHEALERLRAAGRPLIDLTLSNPTKAGIDYPADLLAPLAARDGLRYEPSPFGLAAAREAVARVHGGAAPDRVVLTASSSEAYSLLFKLLCDPGDEVLVPRPSYPLFEHLTQLESVRAVPYDLRYHGRWEIDFESVAAAPPETKALIGAFKTASLRGVPLRAPYFHDGRAKTVEEAADIMMKGGIPNPHLDEKLKAWPVTPEQRTQLLAFLRSLAPASNPYARPEVP